MSVAAEPAADPAPARKRAMFIVFLVVAIDLLGFGIVLPLVPRYGDTLLKGYDPTATGVIIGLMYSLFSLMQFVFSPVWGRVSDRIGRRPILLMSLTGSVVFYALFAFASDLEDQPTLAIALLFVSRIGAGIAGASVSTAAAVIADCTPPERRAKGMALIGAAFGIGFTFGPLIAWAGDFLVDGSPWGPGLVAAGISAVALALAAVLLPETLPPGEKPPREFFSVGRSLAVLRDPAVGPLVLIYFLAIFAFANFEGTLSLFTDKAFGLGRRDNYLVFAGIGFVLVLAQGAYRKLVGKRDEWYLLTLGAGLMLAGLGGLAMTAYGTYLLRGSVAGGGLMKFFLFSVAVAVVGFAFVNSSTSALVSRRADPSRQGEVLGVNQSFAALGRILGPFLGVVLFQASESRVLPYAQAAVLMVLVVGLLPNARAGRFTAEGAEGAEKEPRSGS